MTDCPLNCPRLKIEKTGDVYPRGQMFHCGGVRLGYLRRRWKDCPMDLATLSGRLRWARERAGLTQEQLGEHAGMKQSKICRLETPGDDDRHLTGTIRRLAAALGVSPGWLAWGEAGNGPEKAPRTPSNAIPPSEPIPTPPSPPGL